MMDRKYIPPPKISDEHVSTVQRSTNYVRALFEAIQKRYGEDAARKLFAPYGRALSRREKGHRENAKVLWELLIAEQPNIAALARKRAGKYGNPESVNKQIDRFKKHPKIRAIVEEMAHDHHDGADPFLEFGQYIRVISQLYPGDPDEPFGQ